MPKGADSDRSRQSQRDEDAVAPGLPDVLSEFQEEARQSSLNASARQLGQTIRQLDEPVRQADEQTANH